MRQFALAHSERHDTALERADLVQPKIPGKFKPCSRAQLIAIS
jgi:hypothetical protein